MNILEVCPAPFGTPEGGIAEYVNNVARILARRHQVTVYGTNPKHRFPRVQNIDGVRVERFKHYAPSGAYLFSLELPLRLRKSKFDIVHGHGYHSFPLHLCTLAKCKKFIAQTHFHGHGHTIFRDSLLKLLKPFGKRTLCKADKIIAVSEYEKSLLQKIFKFDSSKIAVIPNGLNLNEFCNIRRHEHDFKSILYVGMLQKYKGPQYLLEVLPKLDDDVVLEIVGKGPLRRSLQLRAKKLQIVDRVRFSQDLPRHELLQKYVDADVFVLLSRYEAYSIVVAEALTAGKPCIVARASALTEWIDEENCFGVDFPINAAKLANLIKDILDGTPNNKNARKYFGNKILDWKDVVKRLENIYLS